MDATRHLPQSWVLAPRILAAAARAWQRCRPPIRQANKRGTVLSQGLSSPNDDSLLDGDLILALRQGLKAQLERQLNSTRTTDLVERAQSSAPHVPRVLGTAEALAQRELGLAELRIQSLWTAEISYRRSKIRMVQDIEQFCAELQFQAVADREVAMHRKVPLDHTKTSHCVS